MGQDGGGVKTRMHITGKTLLNGVQKKKKACSSCGEKKQKTNYVNLLSNNRAIFHAVWKTRRISKAPRRYGELSDNRGGCRSTGSCNWVQSLITGGVSFICLSGKKKKKSESWGSPSIFHDQWVFLPQHLRLHFGALDNSIRVERWCVCQHLVNILTTHYTLSELWPTANCSLRLFVKRC